MDLGLTVEACGILKGIFDSLSLEQE